MHRERTARLKFVEHFNEIRGDPVNDSFRDMMLYVWRLIASQDDERDPAVLLMKVAEKRGEEPHELIKQYMLQYINHHTIDGEIMVRRTHHIWLTEEEEKGIRDMWKRVENLRNEQQQTLQGNEMGMDEKDDLPASPG